MERFKSWLKDQWLLLFPTLSIQPIEEKTLVEQTVYLLNSIEPLRFEKYAASSGHGYGVSVLYSHFDMYIAGMQKHVTSMQKSDGAVNELECVRNKHHVALNYFFLSSDGYYQNIKEDLTSFKIVALELCSLLTDSQTKTTPAGKYNNRVLTPLIENIHSLTLVFLELQNSNTSFSG